MSTTENTGQGPANARTLTLGSGREVTVERVSARKASAAFALIRGISGKVPPLVHKWGQFQAEYESSHTVEVDRPMAMLRYGPRPLLDEQGVPLIYPATINVNDGQGGIVEQEHPRAGEVVMAPSPLEGMTEEAWAANGNRMRMPKSPGWGESAVAVLPDIIEEAEDHLWRLLALFITPNAEVKTLRSDGKLKAHLEEEGERLADDEYLDDLLELAVVCGDVVDATFRRKAAEIGSANLGNVLRLLGLDPAAFQGNTQGAPQTGPEAPQTDGQEGATTPETTSSSETGPGTPPSSTPTSSGSTDDSASVGGTPSTSPTTSSPPSAGEPTPSMSG